nr:ribonuclease H-like domain-containing protein [Tanacetum cinerariifolium]
VQDYALCDVIENENSFVPVIQTSTAEGGVTTTTISSPVTAEDKLKKKNDVKARSMLLMALPNGNMMTFNQYKDAKTLFDAIETRFGGNESTKKTQKTLLKKLYENFSALSTKSLDSIFNRLQKIVNLDTMSIDDIYNNFKIVKQEVKGTRSSKSSSQNMPFVSSPSNNSTNEVNIAYGVSTASTQETFHISQISRNSMEDMLPLGEEKIVAKLLATLDESMLWHRRLGHIKFKIINKLVKDNLVRGLPTKRFENDQTYVSFLRGKQQKASWKFDGKSDEGYFIGYSLNSKAFRVYNLRTRKVKENLHIRFLEDKHIVVGTNSNGFTDGSPLFDSSSKLSNDDKSSPSSGVGKKHDEDT